MCVISMCYDHKVREWERRYFQPEPTTYPNPYLPPPPLPTREELAEFYRLLERAREYDRRTGQPDCESEDGKKKRFLELAKELGVEVTLP